MRNFATFVKSKYFYKGTQELHDKKTFNVCIWSLKFSDFYPVCIFLENSWKYWNKFYIRYIYMSVSTFLPAISVFPWRFNLPYSLIVSDERYCKPRLWGIFYNCKRRIYLSWHVYKIILSEQHYMLVCWVLPCTIKWLRYKIFDIYDINIYINIYLYWGLLQIEEFCLSN